MSMIFGVTIARIVTFASDVSEIRLIEEKIRPPARRNV
ncbi:hypothetical protein HDG32_003600 [Paraburkholderia sp. CI2]|nr:hypothetical protein [Paraburkholderia sp. CI2]